MGITIQRYRRIPNTKQHEFHLKIRVVKGDPNSDLVVRMVDDIVEDDVEISMNDGNVLARIIFKKEL